jgi:hypothetical protein
MVTIDYHATQRFIRPARTSTKRDERSNRFGADYFQSRRQRQNRGRFVSIANRSAARSGEWLGRVGSDFVDEREMAPRSDAAEIEKYLALLPRVRFIALERERNVWAAWPAHSGDARFRLNGAAPVRGSGENVQPFDTFLARFDGTHFWFEAPDSRRSPAFGQFLRESLSSTKAPAELQKKGLSSEERAAYAFALYGPPVEPEIEAASSIVASSTKPTEPIVSAQWRGIGWRSTGALHRTRWRAVGELHRARGRLYSDLQIRRPHAYVNC